MEEVAAEWLSWYENWGKCSCSSAIEFKPPPLPKQPWSGGVSSTLSPVNSLSKYRVSISEVTCGLKGGGIFFWTRSAQLIHEKNAWFMMSFASLGPPPNLLLGSFISKPVKIKHKYNFICNYRTRTSIRIFVIIEACNTYHPAYLLLHC